MKQTREQKEKKLRKAADEMIEGLLAWDEENRRANLTQIEDKILELRQRVGEEMMRVVVGSQEEGQPGESPKCAQCGEEMRNKGQKERSIESRVGGLTIERGYYYCTCCKSGFFPPGPTTGVRRRGME